ncbi:MAG TPA: VOC family protein [Armatimonadota bacterium]|jgi:glyoxylase I family protein|nr:VOC family protein [Armatimonadota bacterium]HOJ20318.1 VOC family protein [Armatimonadota bacterium]HOM81871.1 VOC family protein [Armatimonadota bacterium]HOQ28247.1 VOC family protein [Armatimonadota bacterium]HPO74781.1 VOC family protein [Armatimonadota bacterium]
MAGNTVVAGCGFHHVAIQTTDYEATKQFYTQVLGFRPANEWTMDVRQLCLLDMGDGGYVEVVGIPESMVPEGNIKQFPMVHLAIRVADVDAAVDRVRAAGRPITIEPKDVLLGTVPARIAFFQGPNGEVIELFQEK